MKHGRVNPGTELSIPPTGLARLTAPFRRHKWIGIVILPTLLVAFYYLLIAAGQYESEAHFLVRTTESKSAVPSGLGQALSLVSGASNTTDDAASVSDYLSSHDAVDSLRAHAALVESYRRPEADMFSILRPADPSPERLLAYFRKHADIKLDDSTGITTIRVRSFRPQDSYRIVDSLLSLGEARVNALNQRAYDSTLGVARRQLADAEQALSQAQASVTSFRQGRHNIDPVATGEAQIGVVSALQTSLAQARAQLGAMSGLSSSSPQVRAIQARVSALQAQVGAEQARLTGGSNAIAADVGNYQGLQLRQKFAEKRYADAAAAVQTAREQAAHQQLFIVRIVQPNMPVKALYPKGLKIVLTVFFTLVIVYSLGWLIAAGVREHAA